MEILKQRAMPASAQKVLRYLAAAAAGCLLSGGRISGIHLPFAVCLVSALGPGAPGICAYLGSAAGCLLLWDADFALVTLTGGFLSLVLQWSLQEMPLAEKPWFPAFSALFPGLIICTLCLLAGDFSLRSILTCLLQLVLLPVGTWAAQNVLEKPTGPGLCAALFALCSGSGCCTPGGVPLGGILAGGAVFSLTGTVFALPAAVLTGLALDWSWGGDTSCTAVLAAAAMAAAALHRQKPAWQLLGYGLAAGGAAVACGGGGLLVLAVLPGAVAAFFLPKIRVEEPSRFPMEAVHARLQSAGRALNDVYCLLDDVPAANQHLEIAEIYDKATSRVCAACANFARCWKQQGEKTRQYLLQAAPAVFTRRMAREEDFPPEFCSECRHVPKLMQAITTALEQDAQRRQRENFRREVRTVMAGQYRILSDYLRCGALAKVGEKPAAFAADTGLCSCGLDGGTSGDRCMSFRVGQRQYLLLCDGVGTGQAAAEDSRRAARLLTSLLRAGMAPDDALETLGAAAILQDRGGFSTADLAWVSLATGEGFLYKWGGGDSWLLSEGKAKKIGTATLPPGLGVGGTQVAQQIRLSLGRGEVLILTSDGVDGEDVRRHSAVGQGLDAQTLAAAVVGTGKGEDDRSAAVLRLRSSSAR